MKKGKGSLVKSTLLITFCSLIGIAINFISQLIIAYYFGAKFERDSYFVANTIPVYLSAIYTGSIGILFLPKVVDILNNDPKKFSEFFSTIFWSLALISIMIGGLCVFFSSKIVGIVASGFDHQKNVFTSKILIIIIPTFIFSILANLLSSLYQIQHKFLRPALAPIVTSIISLLFVIILSKRIGIFGLAIGFLFGSMVSFIYLLPIVKTFKLKLYINLKSSDLLAFIKSVVPLYVGGILFRSTTIFEREIASNLETGSISYLGYSSQIIAILATLTSSGIGVSIYPTLSKLWSENKLNELKEFFNRSIRIIFLITLPVSLLIIFFGDLFIRIVFERGAFNHFVTISVSKALAWSIGGFIFQGLGMVVAKIFYISGKTFALTIIGCIEILIYLLVGLILSHYYSFIGLSIALSFSSMVNILLSVIYIKQNILGFRFKILFKDLFKILTISLFSILFIYFIYYFIFKHENMVYLIFSLFLGFLAFILLGIKLKVEEILYLKARFIEFRRR